MLLLFFFFSIRYVYTWILWQNFTALPEKEIQKIKNCRDGAQQTQIIRPFPVANLHPLQPPIEVPSQGSSRRESTVTSPTGEQGPPILEVSCPATPTRVTPPLSSRSRSPSPEKEELWESMVRHRSVLSFAFSYLYFFVCFIALMVLVVWWICLFRFALCWQICVPIVCWYFHGCNNLYCRM